MSTPLPLIRTSDDSTNASFQRTLGYYINDNSSQDISALDVRNVFDELAKATYATKTIWSGIVFINNRDCTATNSRGEWIIWENYYDPNYFIVNEPGNAAQVGRKYQIASNGNGVPNGSYKGVSTTNINGSGKGLTFNVVAENGGFRDLEVVNQGSGYFSRDTSHFSGLPNANTADDERVYLNLPTAGERPQVRINLRNTIRVTPYSDGNGVQFANGWAYNTLKLTLIEGNSRFWSLDKIIPVWTDIFGSGMDVERSQSRIGWPMGATNWETSQSFNYPSSTATFSLAQQYQGGGTNQLRGYLELKAPIV